MIKTHKDLAKVISNKSILHLNSFGKDSLVVLDYLCNYAKVERVVSVNFRFLVRHPKDAEYFNYLKKIFPRVEFIERFNAHEISNIGDTNYQSPIAILKDINNWEYYDFSMKEQARAIKKEYGLDYIAIGNSKYESVARAQLFYKKGIMIDDLIYPLGLWTKKDVLNVIKIRKLKVHPCYKLHQSTPDYPSYYKLRASFVSYPDYEKEFLKFYPMLRLDKYRYEKLFKENKND